MPGRKKPTSRTSTPTTRRSATKPGPGPKAKTAQKGKAIRKGKAGQKSVPKTKTKTAKAPMAEAPESSRTPQKSSGSPRRRGAERASGDAQSSRRPAAKPAAKDESHDKLQKLLADLGYGSRRQLEQWIAAGRIEVNGEPAHIGQRVSADDVVHVDGKPVSRAPGAGCRVLVMNKPAGVICTRHDPEGRTTVFDDLPPLRSGRWISVGRLDVQTSGLLLITNDGALAHRMMHPSTGLDREYAVRLKGRLSDEQLAALTEGIDVEGETLCFSDVQYYNGSGTNHWYHVVLMEGRNREVRRLFEAVGLTVSRLKRVRYGPVVLPSTLRNGQLRELAPADLKALYRLLRLPLTLPRQRARRGGRHEREQSLLLPYPALPAR